MTSQKATFAILTTLSTLLGLSTLMTTAAQAQANIFEKVTVIKPVIALSKPSFTDRIDRVRDRSYLSTIQGKVNSTNPDSSKITCSQITVELTESVPTKQIPGTLGSNPTISQLSQVTATGSNLASGCTYKITYGGDGKPVKNTYGSSSYRINASSAGSSTNSGGWFGGQGFNEIPRVFDLSMQFSRGLN